jgi:hypothetical protein
MVAAQEAKARKAARDLDKAELGRCGPRYYSDAELGARVVRLRNAVPYDRKAHGAAVLEVIRRLNRRVNR